MRNIERADRLSTPVATRAEVANLDEDERRLLAGWLAERSLPPTVSRAVRRRRFITLVVSASVAVVLAAWIGVLSVTLPDHYAAHEWRVAWIGFDVASGPRVRGDGMDRLAHAPARHHRADRHRHAPAV